MVSIPGIDGIAGAEPVVMMILPGLKTSPLTATPLPVSSAAPSMYATVLYEGRTSMYLAWRRPVTSSSFWEIKACQSVRLDCVSTPAKREAARV